VLLTSRRLVASEAVDHLRSLFGAVASPGTAMAVQATEGLEDRAVIAASCVALTADLLEGIKADHD
jgi:hypothetical protein